MWCCVVGIGSKLYAMMESDTLWFSLIFEDEDVRSLGGNITLL